MNSNTKLNSNNEWALDVLWNKDCFFSDEFVLKSAQELKQGFPKGELCIDYDSVVYNLGNLKISFYQNMIVLSILEAYALGRKYLVELHDFLIGIGTRCFNPQKEKDCSSKLEIDDAFLLANAEVSAVNKLEFIKENKIPILIAAIGVLVWWFLIRFM